MFIAACFAWLLPAAHAQTTVDFQVDDARAQQVGVDPTEIEGAISMRIEEALQLVDPDRFMVSMAEAAAIAGKGLGVDYASNPDKFVFGVSIGTGANANGFVLDRGSDELPEAGFAAQTSAMAGVNLGVLAGTAGKDGMQLADRIVLSAHGLAFNSPFANRGFRGFMRNYGGHITVKLVGRGESGIWDWGGLDVTTGFEQATYRLEYTGDAPFETDSGGTTVRWNAQGTYTLSSSVQSIPVEVSTNLRVSVISLYVGVGVDLNVGSSTGVGSLSGPVEVDVSSGTESLGTGDVSSNAAGDVEPMAIRGFGGLQVNIMPVKIYAGLQGSSRASASLQTGIRIAM